jgi:hypothetical protein
MDRPLFAKIAEVPMGTGSIDMSLIDKVVILSVSDPMGVGGSYASIGLDLGGLLALKAACDMGIEFIAGDVQ